MRSWMNALVIVLLAFAAGGCDSDGGGGGTADVQGTDADVTGFVADTDEGDATTGPETTDIVHGLDISTTVCPEPVEVTSASELFEAVGALEWAWLGPYSSEAVPVSDPVAVTGTIVLGAASVTVPPECLDRTDCRHEAKFRIDRAPDGVVGTTEDDIMPWLGAYATVELSDTVVRVRAVLYDTHPEEYNFVPIVEILGGCDAECPEGTQECPRDHLCYSTAPSSGAYCRLCAQLPKETCACWTPDGPVDDGTQCYFMVSGDVMCDGTCSEGVCLSNEPGWAGCP